MVESHLCMLWLMHVYPLLRRRGGQIYFGLAAEAIMSVVLSQKWQDHDPIMSYKFFTSRLRGMDPLPHGETFEVIYNKSSYIPESSRKWQDHGPIIGWEAFLSYVVANVVCLRFSNFLKITVTTLDIPKLD